MKINSLRFANLNSLKGEFFIDFKSSPLADSGIFAITGATGAGKTTLLDAIAIALYGQTPRLNAGSSGEIMSRQTGECYAEVEFSVESGVFRSRWGRKRAHGKALGKLQNPKMELGELGGGEDRIVEDQIRPVIARVEKLTGLDFNRFTRSVMLAQGNFASFLQAKGNERAELLEKMTGTEIYSYISMEAFERARTEKHKLDKLIMKHSSLEIMAESALKDLQKKKDAVSKEVKNIQERVDALIKLKQIRISYDELQAAITACGIELKEIDQQQEDHAKDFDRLVRAEAVMPMEADYRSIKDIEIQQQDKVIEKRKLVDRVTELHELLKNVLEEQKRLNKKKQELQDKWESRDKEIDAANKIDQLLLLEEEKILKLKQSITQFSEKVITAKKQKQSAFNALKVQKKKVDTLESFLADNASDLGLGNALAGISQKITELKQLRGSMAEKKSKLADLNKEKGILVKRNTSFVEQHGQALTIRDSIQKAITEAEEVLAVKCEGQALEKLEGDLEASKVARQQIVDLVALDEESRRITGECEVATLKLSAFDTDLQVKKKDSVRLDREKSSQLNVLKQLQAKQKLELQIKKYEEDRKKLLLKEPCPLCGAVEHPWADSAPADDTLEQALNDQEVRVGMLTGQLGSLNGEVKTLEASKEQLASELKVLEKKKNECVFRRDEFLKNSPLLGKSKDEVLYEQIAIQEKIKLLSSKINETRDLEKQLTVQRKKLVPAEQSLSELNNTLEKIVTAMKSADDDISRLNVLMPEITAKLAELEHALAKELKTYLLDVPEEKSEDLLIMTIQLRWQSYDKARNEFAALKQVLLGLENNFSSSEKDIKALSELTQKEEQEFSVVTKHLEELKDKRSRLLENCSVGEARKSLGVERDEFYKRQNEIGIRASEFAREQKTKQEDLAASDTAIKNNEKRLAKAREKVSAQLLETGFKSIDEIAECFLLPKEFNTLKKQRQDISDRRTAVQALLHDAEKNSNEIAGQATDLSLDTVAENLGEEQKLLSLKDQEIGEINAVSKRQNDLRLSHKRQADEIAGQQKEYMRWQVLNDLLGSADGKKYRRFAQGLTLDHLLYLANSQLIRLNDRYLLQRGHDELEIEVVDTYQADTVRSTDTLSGGEEFLVSLALALGLSSLAGSSSSIDSLFLDEGFGTLDTETLETAVAALASLHESGKTIGVISHVDALKERIPVQIQIHKEAGGFSALSVVA